ncbi:MAG: hypothetical protein N2201_04160 [candidate division WOR-3 bacterium]|nr:hypothetical protein [candidate division WOR-3 bacterium]
MKSIINGFILSLIFITTTHNNPPGWRNDTFIPIPHKDGQWVHSLDVNNGFIHIATNGGAENSECDSPRYVRSSEGGLTWNIYPIDQAWGGVQPTPCHSYSAIISHSNKVIGLFGIIEMVISNDCGITWPYIWTRLGYSSGCPALLKAPDAFYAFWHDGIQSSPPIDEIFFKKSGNGDNWWSYFPMPGRIDGAQRITVTNGLSRYPDIAKSIIVQGGEECQLLHLVWSKYCRTSPHEYEIYYNSSVDGSEWTYGSVGYRISYTNKPSLYPAVAAYSWLPSVHCVWQEGEGNSAQIWYARSPDNGRTWSEPIFLAMGEHPDIAVDHQGVHIVFSSNWVYREGEMPQFIESEIYYINSPDFGITWGSLTRLTNAIHNSEYPKIVADVQGRHVIFSDWRDGGNVGAPKLWYKQNDITVPAIPRGLKMEYVEDPNQNEPRWTLVFAWEPNNEPDLLGYNIYRSTNGRPFVRINETIISQPIYKDNVGPGYYLYYITALDLAENESDHSEYVKFLSPKYDFDIGLVEPSEFVVDRAGYIVWGDSSTKCADIGNNQIIYHISGLNPDKEYDIGIVLSKPSTAGTIFQTFLLDNNPILNSKEVPNEPEIIFYTIPNELYTDGELYLTVSKIDGEFAIISEVYVFEYQPSNSGSQSGGNIGCFQNPFNLEVNPSIFKISSSISFTLPLTLPLQTKVSLKIYSSSGRLVRTLQNGLIFKGNQRFIWDGKDDYGREVPSGIYIVNLAVENKITNRRISIVR